MTISDKDIDFMNRVAKYYISTKPDDISDGSIRDTAMKFGISRNKVRKILLTLGAIDNDLTNDVLKLREEGLSIKEIATALGVSVATVSTAIPYDTKYDNSLDPSKHAAEVRSYREYEKNRLNRLAGHKVDKDIERIKDGGETNKMRNSIGNIDNNVSCIRLHMEAFSDYIDEESIEVFHKYGGLKYGDNISRDIIVPSDIPLYALHYTIQRAFGWQNSHLHKFILPESVFEKVTDNKADIWKKLVGVIFRSPFMDDSDRFWTDDYDKGSFKNWLRSKYTGPYLSMCYGEGIHSCSNDMRYIKSNEMYYVLHENSYNPDSDKYDGPEYVSTVIPIYDRDGSKNNTPKPWHSDEVPYRVSECKFKDIPSEGLKFMFEYNPQALLERLPVSSLLYSESDIYNKSYISPKNIKGSNIYSAVKVQIKDILDRYVDAPDIQPILPYPITDTLLYNYDFGDDWWVKITLCDDYNDLIDSGRISKKQLEKSISKCKELYRPVLIARDGEMLIDDVGGLNGFADFLERINYIDPYGEVHDMEALDDMRANYLWWASGQGWHINDAHDFNLL